MKLAILTIFLASLLLFGGSGCSNREASPVTEADLTMVYPAKNADGISAKITLCRKVDKKTGNQIGAGTIFTSMEKSNIRAIIDLENCFLNSDRELMFHLDWIGSNGRSFYRKQIIITPDHSSSVINSSISISPDIRQAGQYSLRLYLFRELIAEKKFNILPKFQAGDFIIGGQLSTVTLYSKLDKKTGKRMGTDTVFAIRKNAKIRAFYELENKIQYGERELLFRFDWVNEKGETFYRKRIDISPDDTSTTLNSSISISPEKRQAGNYQIRLFLFNELIAENNFELLSEAQLFSSITEGITTEISLYKKKSKKTGKRIGEGTVFTIKEKGKVRAHINIKNPNANGDKELIFRLEWIDPKGISFYKKDIDLPAKERSLSINSSISITSSKRQAGNYKLRLYLFDKLISEKKFELR